MGLPLQASVCVTAPEMMEIKAIADVFSGSCDDLEGSLYYDSYSEQKNLQI